MINWRSDYDREIYEKILVPGILERPTSVFVGSGLSVHAGYPLLEGNGGLIPFLHERAEEYIGDKIPLDGDWKQKAQICRNRIGIEKFNEFLIERFSPDNNQQDTTSIHRDLVHVPFNGIITTNYDSCIEKAFEKEEIEVNLPLYHPYLDLTVLKDKIPTIQHIHGYIDPANPLGTIGSVILTTDDFLEGYPVENPGQIREFLYHLFDHQSVIFLGFGFDEELIDILEIVKERKEDQRIFAENRKLDPPSTKIQHFAILENKLIIKDQKFSISRLDEPELGISIEQEIAFEDAYLRALNVTALRFDAGKVYKSVERIISDIKTKTQQPDSELKGVEV